MIRKLLASKGFDSAVVIMPTECTACPVYHDKKHSTGRQADMTVPRHTIYTDYQLARLRLMGPRIYELRTKLTTCAPEQRKEAYFWLHELDELCRARITLISEALGIQDENEDEPGMGQAGSAHPTNW